MAADLKSKVLKQVEFYFGDSNFPRDRFLKDLANKNEGWVPISVLATFKRVKELTTDLEVIADALLQSAELLHVSEDRKMVKRATPIPEDLDATKRTIYAKGFPLDSTLDDLQAYFESFGPVLSVRMRRTIETRAFKGSVFVEFPTEEAAAAYLAEPRVYKEAHSLITMSKTAFTEQKKEEYEARKAKRSNKGEGDAAAAPAAAVPTEPMVQEDCVLKIEEISGEGITRESLKDLLGEFGKVQFVDYSRGNASGYVRFADGGARRAAQTLTEKGVEFNGQKPKFTALEGDENKAYFAHVAEEQSKRRKGPNKSNPKRQRHQQGGSNKRARKDE